MDSVFVLVRDEGSDCSWSVCISTDFLVIYKAWLNRDFDFDCYWQFWSKGEKLMDYQNFTNNLLVDIAKGDV